MATSVQHPTPSFMMLCLGDFSSNLCIPTKFMSEYRQAMQHSIVLETEYSPTRWDVKIKNLNSDFYMKDGWPEFVKDNQLGELNFLTFRLMGESTFKVSIYRGDGCPKHHTSPMSSRGGEVDKIESGIKSGSVRPPKRKRGAKMRTRNCFTKEGNLLYFETRLKSYHRSNISLPHAFSRAAKMEVKEQVRMEFEGNCHGFCVAVYPKRRRPTINLTNGWREFWEANGLVQGKMYSFEFNPDDQVIYVKEVAS